MATESPKAGRVALLAVAGGAFAVLAGATPWPYQNVRCPINGLNLAPAPPLAVTTRGLDSSSTGDACHGTRQPPPRVKYSNP
jgi:hypothetical protein